jgi:predicted DNA-binding protein
MKTISLKIDAHLYSRLEQQSRKLGRSKSAIMRDALEGSLKKKGEPSCHDLMQEACGSFRSGVKDLATNKKYMKGFGEWKR